MCNFQELSRSKGGYVIRCNDCGHYQVYFSGLVLSLTQREFARWLTYIEDYVCPVNENGSLDERSAFIATPKAGVHLAVSPDDHARLQALMQKADNEAKALEMLALFGS